MTGKRAGLSAAIAARLEPSLRGLGFTSEKGLRWREGDLEIRVVIDLKPNDPFRGRAFTLEFERSGDGRFEVKLAGRVRVNQLLDDDQRMRFLEQRNLVASRLQRPDGQFLAALPDFVREEYLRAFEPVQELEPRPWMRFGNARDAEEWCTLLSEMMPTLVSRARTVNPHALLLGTTLSR